MRAEIRATSRQCRHRCVDSVGAFLCLGDPETATSCPDGTYNAARGPGSLAVCATGDDPNPLVWAHAQLCTRYLQPCHTLHFLGVAFAVSCATPSVDPPQYEWPSQRPIGATGSLQPQIVPRLCLVTLPQVQHTAHCGHCLHAEEHAQHHSRVTCL